MVSNSGRQPWESFPSVLTMKTEFSAWSERSCLAKRRKGSALEQGSALLLTLFMLVLITLLVSAFLSLTTNERRLATSDASNFQAESIAKAAGTTVIGDLKQEMYDGSYKVDASPVAGGPPALEVWNDTTNMVPTLAVSPAVSSDTTLSDYRGLIKQSFSGTNFYAVDSLNGSGIKKGPSRASDVNSSSDASVDGRVIAPARWDKPTLTSAPLNTAALAPDWVYVTRSGMNPTSYSALQKTSLNTDGSLNTNYVVGRYAYNVYNIGGLINANVGGYPSSPTTPAAGSTLALAAEKKGSEIFAAFYPNISTTLASALPAWRTALDWTALDSNFAANGPLNLLSEGRRIGWTSGLPTTANGTTSTDDAFVSRQDLLNWINSPAVGMDYPRAAANNLTHFNWALNAPAVLPPLNAGGNAKYAYRQLASNGSDPNNIIANDQKTVANPFAPNVRNTTTGNPIMQTRFDLSRINYFNNPTGANLSLIQTYFGLTQDADDFRWIYQQALQKNSPNNNSVGVSNQVHIRTLQQVAAAGGTPDFFETLKAAILSGSLGLAETSTKISWGITNQLGLATGNGHLLDDDRDVQILRIGANIISQYIAATSNPIVIRYDSSLVDDIYGVGNFPYLYMMPETYCIDETTVLPTPPHSLIRYFFRFELWNPHRNAATAASTPGNYRIAAVGTVQPAVNYIYNQNPPPPTTPNPFYLASKPLNTLYNVAGTFNTYGSPGPPPTPQGVIDFTVSPALSFVNPTLLVSGSNHNATVDPELSASQQANCVFTPAGLIGLFCGTVQMPGSIPIQKTQATAFGLYLQTDVPVPPAPPPPANPEQVQATVAWTNGQKTTPGTFYLQKSINGTWRTYSVIPNFQATYPLALTYVDGDSDGDAKSSASLYNTLGENFNLAFFTCDPRSYRFGWGGQAASNWAGGYTAPPQVPPNSPVTANQILPSGASFGTGWTGTAAGFSNGGQINIPTGTTTGTDSAALSPYYLSQNNKTPGYCYVNSWDLASGPRNGDTPWGNPFLKANLPIFLNRPFQSVAEMACAFRDEPFKSLSFVDNLSADGALLDYFYIGSGDNNTPTTLVTERTDTININAAPTGVLTALLQGAQKDLTDPTTTLDKNLEAPPLATAIRNYLDIPGNAISSNGGLINAVNSAASTFGWRATSASPGSLNVSKDQQEVLSRALADVADTRTWNLLIDVDAQSGTLVNTTLVNTAASLKDFKVRGEKRYWISVAIDRITGQVLKESIEPVVE